MLPRNMKGCFANIANRNDYLLSVSKIGHENKRGLYSIMKPGKWDCFPSNSHQLLLNDFQVNAISRTVLVFFKINCI